MARLQLRLWFQRRAPLYALRALSRVPPVRLAGEPPPDNVMRAASATAASPPNSRITTPLAINNAVSSKGVRTPLAPTGRERPSFPGTPPPALQILLLVGDMN